MGCSMRTDQWGDRAERRRRFGGVSRPFLRRKEKGKGRKGKQDKGSVSRHCLSDCLHILFPRDMVSYVRDSGVKNGGNPPFSDQNREIWPRRHV
jgi:hypothetical protein